MECVIRVVRRSIQPGAPKLMLPQLPQSSAACRMKVRPTTPSLTLDVTPVQDAGCSDIEIMDCVCGKLPHCCTDSWGADWYGSCKSWTASVTRLQRECNGKV
jgi:hypothetical protein